MDDLLTAFGSSISVEIDRGFIQKLQIGIFIDNIGGDRAFHVQCTVVDGSIYFHTAGIEHRTEQRIFRQIVIQQYGHTQHFERRKTDQGHIPSVTNAFRHRNTDPESGVRTRSATHRNCIQRYGMTINER